MWRLERIIAENLCAFRSLDYHLKGGVTTLVFGDNRDNESQRSNGSGKSALLEAIAVGITGSPMRKIKNEEIIRDDADECWICLAFSNDASDERFSIERRLSRKSASQVVCHIERDGKPVETDEAVQPSVDAYNRYILEKLGITREELYNNFLLSKYKYAEFLSASDREKKEIINRFSGADMVDRAIDRLAEDRSPVEQEVRDAELELAGVDGRIAVLQEQIETEAAKSSERARRKEEQKKELEERIARKRASIRQSHEQLEQADKTNLRLKEADAALQALENGDRPLEECLSYITRNIKPILPGTLTDWHALMEDKRKQLVRTGENLKALDDRLREAETATGNAEQAYRELSESYKTLETETGHRQSLYEEKLKDIRAELSAIDRRIREQKQQRLKLASEAGTLRNKLAGTIVCPACGHEFLTAESSFDVPEGRKRLAATERQEAEVETEIIGNQGELERLETTGQQVREDSRKIEAALREFARKVDTAEFILQGARRKSDELRHGREQAVVEMTALQKDLDSLHRKLFDEVFGLLDDAYRMQEKLAKSCGEDIRMAEAAIRTLERNIEDLEHTSPEDMAASLRQSLKEARKQSATLLEKKENIENRLRILQEQEQHFIGFKSHLANTKIEALAQVTNEFLENIGSDIRIRFSGYTVLKTGKVREKISISLLRDGVDCGSFGKFSAGEAARVNLATILAMQKLVNGNCADGKGLDLLVLDEILEAVDEEGLSSMFGALNRLGITALVVSHGNIAESYPHKLLICKENGESKIE